MSTRIRAWCESDIEAIRKITWETWLSAYGSFIPEDDLLSYFNSAYTPAVLRELQSRPNVDGYVAEEPPGTVVGYLKTHLEAEEKRFYVSSVYIHPSSQGKGIGTALMKTAENRAFALGMSEVWLGVMLQNVPALDWYKRTGFHFVEEAPFTMGNTTVVHAIGYKTITRDISHSSGQS